jgi:glycerol-3-phosphate dehydrogenase
VTNDDARARALDELSNAHFDVLVVGAGIVGSRIAYEAARVGLRVALVDAGDFGGETSSASSKFVHGGLRYMTSWQLRLVRSAQREREALFRIAPHLVRRRPMVLAERAGYPLPVYAAGLALYKGISGAATPWPRIISVRRGQELAPFLHPDGFRTCTLLPEAQTDDFRLTLATVRAAVAHGACAVSYVRAVDLERADGRVAGAALDVGDGNEPVTVRADVVVNATGPWVDGVRELEDPRCTPLVRLSKGAHVVLPLAEDCETGVASSRDGSRTTFAVPFHGMLLIGVTDTPHEGLPGDVHASPEDVDELFDDASRFVAAELLDRDRVRYSFAGLRALTFGDGDTGLLPREHVVSTGPGGMISVAGGKLTTHRLIAVDVLRRLPPNLRPRRVRPSNEPLPGAEPLVETPTILRELDKEVTEHLLSLYGSDVDALLSYGEADPSLLERIDPGAPDIWAQVPFAVDHEWAVTVDDVVRRRTTLAFRGLDGPVLRARVASTLARERTSSGPSSSLA